MIALAIRITFFAESPAEERPFQGREKTFLDPGFSPGAGHQM
jgi:hypothetical protein